MRARPEFPAKRMHIDVAGEHRAQERSPKDILPPAGFSGAPFVYDTFRRRKKGNPSRERLGGDAFLHRHIPDVHLFAVWRAEGRATCMSKRVNVLRIPAGPSGSAMMA
jgi:hypothetical protein